MKRIWALALVLVTGLTFTACEGLLGKALDATADYVASDEFKEASEKNANMIEDLVDSIY